MNIRPLFFLLVFTFITLISSASVHENSKLVVSPSRSIKLGHFARKNRHTYWAKFQSLTIPRAQLDTGIPIFYSIFSYLAFLEFKTPLLRLHRIFSAVTFLFWAQLYFGFILSFPKRKSKSKNSYRYFNEVYFKKADFRTGREIDQENVSIGRWISGPFAWISEILCLLPDETYTYLTENLHLPQRSVIHVLFIIQLMYYFGIFDYIATGIIPRISQKNIKKYFKL